MTIVVAIALFLIILGAVAAFYLLSVAFVVRGGR